MMQDLEDIYELSPMQQGMLFHNLLAPESGMYCQQLRGTLEGELDLRAFKRAWQQVVARHAALRTSFHWDEVEKPLQVVRRHVRLPWHQEDWRALGSDEQQARLREYQQNDLAKGYDLTNPPLMRLALFQLADQTFEIIWSFHHLLMDGWCISLVLKEVLFLYEAERSGQTLQLERPRPYRDYIAWLQRQDTAKAETFWRAALEGLSAPTHLSGGKRSETAHDREAFYGEREMNLTAETTAALQALARQYQLTVNALVQGAWAILLSRYSRQDDVVFGATVSGRPASLAGVESMIGLFINTLPVRVKLSPREPVISQLKKMQDNVAGLRQYEYSSLVDIQGWSEVPRSLPLFESLLVFENYPVDPAMREQAKSLRVVEAYYVNKNNYPLTLIIVPGAQLHLRMKYDLQRFDDVFIERMFGHFRNLLEGIISNPLQKLSALSPLTPAERQRILTQWNDTDEQFEQHRPVHELFEAQAEKNPEATALVCEDVRLSYRELNERANQLARYLRSRGIGPDVVAGICLDRSAEAFVSLLAVLKAGGAYLPLDPAAPGERLGFMLTDAKAPLVITRQALAGKLSRDGMRVLCLDRERDEISRENRGNIESGAAAENLAYVIFTSGSTGRPKGVGIEHRQLLNYIRAITKRFSLKPGYAYANVSTLAADLGNTMIFPALCVGGCLHVISQERVGDAAALAEYFTQHPIDCLKIVPSHLEALLNSARPEQLVPRERLILGGEASHWSLIERLRSLSPTCEIFNHYGPTETTVGVITYHVQDEQAAERSATVPLGRPIANTKIYLLDTCHQPVTTGMIGELYVGGCGLGRGYINHPELTAAKFIPHPFSRKAGERLYRTGDIARYLPDGQIEFLGRSDDQIKIRGFRIELKEIEAAFRQHAGVKEAVVVLNGEIASGNSRLAAYVVPEQAGALEGGHLRSFLLERLPDYMIPPAIVLLDALPLTPNGKVDRAALPVPDQTRPEAFGNYVAPRTTLEMMLAEVFAQVLGLSEVGVEDSFFELGGHSLLATVLIFRIGEAFGLRLPLRAVFDSPTVAGLAPLIVQAQTEQFDAETVNSMLMEIERLSEEEALWQLVN